MSFLTAIAEIERLADKLGLKDRFGEPLFSCEAVVCVAKEFGDRWDDNGKNFLTGVIDEESYIKNSAEMIDEFDGKRFSKKYFAKFLKNENHESMGELT